MMNGRTRIPLPQHPTGITGRAFGWLMEKINERAYREALNLLHPLQSERVLEIGYGTGRFVELLLRACNSCYIAGVDPTSTMVRVANSRRAIAANTDRLDLRCGDASALPWT